MRKFLLFCLAITVLLIGFSFFYRYVVHIPEQDKLKLLQASSEQMKSEQIQQEKNELAKKEYIMDRKKQCYEIFEKERKQWSNTIGINYSENDDICRITYKNNSEKYKNCEEWSISSTTPVDSFSFLMRQQHNCENNQFDKEF